METFTIFQLALASGLSLNAILKRVRRGTLVCTLVKGKPVFMFSDVVHLLCGAVEYSDSNTKEYQNRRIFNEIVGSIDGAA